MEPTNARVEGIDQYGQQYRKLAVWLAVVFQSTESECMVFVQKLQERRERKETKRNPKNCRPNKFRREKFFKEWQCR